MKEQSNSSLIDRLKLFRTMKFFFLLKAWILIRMRPRQLIKFTLSIISELKGLTEFYMIELVDEEMLISNFWLHSIK